MQKGDWKSLRSETIRTFNSQSPHGETDNWNASVAMEADISHNDEGRPDEVKGGICKRGCFIKLKRIVAQATSKTFSLRARSP